MTTGVLRQAPVHTVSRLSGSELRHEAERDHLRVGDYIVRMVTMKEAITETRPLVLDALLKIPANFYVATEWTPLPADIPFFCRGIFGNS